MSGANVRTAGLLFGSSCLIQGFTFEAPLMSYEPGTETILGRILDFQRKPNKKHRILILWDCCGQSSWVSLRLYHYRIEAGGGKCLACAKPDTADNRRATGFKPKSKNPWSPAPADLKGILSASDAWPVPPSVKSRPFIWSPK